MSSDSSASSGEEYIPKPVPRPSREKENRTARKSTAPQPTQSCAPRRKQPARKAARALRADEFMANFNPETSAREKRKLYRKLNPPSNVRSPLGAVYDENGVHITTRIDLCDCLNEECGGCFFDCPKCGSQKCGTTCRVHRKYVVNQIDYEGHDVTIRNTLL